MNIPQPDGPVSLGVTHMTDLVCPYCEATTSSVLHNGEGAEMRCCLSCERFYPPAAGSPVVYLPEAGSSTGVGE